MKYINNSYENIHEVKQSKFIAFLVPYTSYKDTLKELKLQHQKARHFVVAYRYLNEFKQIVEHSSDDGEPKGTSGKPTLMVLQGSQLINTAVIIVRYFGGTKLGTGGLVRAYSDATNLVINTAPLFEYKDKVLYDISLEYADIRQVEYECEQNSVEILEKIFDSKIIYKVSAAKEDMDVFLNSLSRLVKII